MITGFEFETACREVAKGMGRIRKRRVHARAEGLAQDGPAGWAFAGRADANIYWPRFEDIYLVAARLRCAVLLDSRRAPRSAPPFSEVLLKLQGNRSAEMRDPDDCEWHSEDLASLGLLRLEDSCFLINRHMLREKLDDALLSSPLSDRVRHSSSASTSRVPTSGRNIGLLDVRGTLAAPHLCLNGALQNQLYAALRSVFGDSAGHLGDPTNAEAPPSCWSQKMRFSCPSSPRVTNQSKLEFKTGGREGVRWLRDWRIKEVILDGEDARERLGDVGMPGLAGWLLEYPVIYCCPSLPEGDRGQGVSRSETGVVANCLGGISLVVYTLRVEFTGDDAKTPENSRSSFEAFSFSIPEPAQVRTGCAEENDATGVPEDQEVATTLATVHSLVDNFLETFKARVTRHNDGAACASCCRDRKRCVLHVSVNSRRETLDCVAL